MKGRIIKGVGGLYTVANDEGELFEGRARGIFRKEGKKPCIGDFAEITPLGDGECVVEKLLPRENSLIRPAVCNVDSALIVCAPREPKLNLDLLNGFLITAESRSIKDIKIVMNKADLDSGEGEETLKRIFGGVYELHFVSCEKGTGLEELKSSLKGKVSVFAGPSGVGKSSLINNICENSVMETGTLSRKISRGRHTTRHVELLKIDDNTYIADSPGFTSIDLSLLNPDDLTDYFKEFKPHLEGCRFRNCRHINEPDCKLKEQVGKAVSKERYDFFKRIYTELKGNK